MSRPITLALTPVQYLELEKIALGAFAPLHGFMDEVEFNSMVETMRLPDGAVFTLPVVLDVDTNTAKDLAARDQVELTFNGEPVGRLLPSAPRYSNCGRTNMTPHSRLPVKFKVTWPSASP